jgi:hypothetical protein
MYVGLATDGALLEQVIDEVVPPTLVTRSDWAAQFDIAGGNPAVRRPCGIEPFRRFWE